MSQQVEHYLERELAFLSGRRDPLARYFAQHHPAVAGTAAAFADRYPEPAGRLELPPKQLTDPHSERMIQGFALLAGRIHHKIHDEFPNLTETLVQILYPHLLRPVPSMSIARFVADWNSATGARGLHVAAGCPLASRPVGHPPLPCLWRTAYPVHLWPVEVSEASLQHPALIKGVDLPPRTGAVLHLRLRCLEPFQFQQLGLDRLRFFLDGPTELMSALYELLFNHATHVIFRSLDPPRMAPIFLAAAEGLAQVGFDLEEGLIPFPCESFVGYRLLTELFTFPSKFLFFEVKGIQTACRAGAGAQLDVLVPFDRAVGDLARTLNPQMLQLGCTPIINLFERVAEPIALTHTRHQYQVVPDRAHAHGVEVCSVDSVSTFDPNTGKVKEFQPFYSFGLGQDRDTHRTFWHPTRQPSSIAERAADVFLVLVDQDFNPRLPPEDSINVYTTCTNRDLPHRMLRAGSELSVRLPQLPFAGSIQLLHTPTAPRPPALEWGTLWRFLSQSSLSHVALSAPGAGLDALKETLILCAGGPVDSAERQQAAVLRQMLEGITAFDSRPVVRPVFRQGRVATVRGMEFTLELDRTKYVGTGAFLVACVLERFLGLYAAVNSFSQLLVQTKQGKGTLKKWPPRAANNPLL
jgi:type VI secretion system protein ImpG